MSRRAIGPQAAANTRVPLPLRDGVAPSYLWVPDAACLGGAPLLGFLLAQFPDVGESVWRARLLAGEVVDGAGVALRADSALTRGLRLWYYRALDYETPIPFTEQILFCDEHLLVVDKPHFLPMMPAGRFVQETLLTRLKRSTGEAALTPIHRLDRETAGVVMFSRRESSRGAYQTLFQHRHVRKTYEAIAPVMPERAFPLTYRSRMVEGTPFFRMCEEAGEPNSETVIDLIDVRGALALYRLHPHTGRKHQLRVHMSALGAPIVNDWFYPDARPDKGDDFDQPLQLLARSIEFDDPITGAPRRFDSQRTL